MRSAPVSNVVSVLNAVEQRSRTHAAAKRFLVGQAHQAEVRGKLGSTLVSALSSTGARCVRSARAWLRSLTGEPSTLAGRTAARLPASPARPGWQSSHASASGKAGSMMSWCTYKLDALASSASSYTHTCGPAGGLALKPMRCRRERLRKRALRSRARACLAASAAGSSCQGGQAGQPHRRWLTCCARRAEAAATADAVPQLARAWRLPGALRGDGGAPPGG